MWSFAQRTTAAIIAVAALVWTTQLSAAGEGGSFEFLQSATHDYTTME